MLFDGSAGRAGSLHAATVWPWDRAIARLLAPRLDRQLAAGQAPESGRYLATRARQLVSPTLRRTLGQNWGGVLDRASKPPTSRTARVQLPGERVIGAEHELRTMIERLSAPVPTPARGVAMASRLLSDGAGPLYNRRCQVGLNAALQQVIDELDPSTSLAQPA